MNKLLYISLLFVFVLHAAENLVQNPSFEDLGPQGAPRFWSFPTPIYSIDSTIRFSGENSLKFSNQDPSIYVYSTQTIMLTPGKSYRFGGKVRYSGVKNGLGDICVELHGADGRFLKGYYPQGPHGFTVEWMDVNGTAINIPQGITRASISCYARKRTTGTIWFDDIFVEEIDMPLLTKFTSSAYRGVSTAETIRFYIGTNRPIKQEELDEGRLSAAFNGNRMAIPLIRSTAQPDMLTLQVAMQSLPMGKMVLEFSIPDTKGDAKVTLPFERVQELPSRKVYVDEMQRLNINGKPVFPLGMFLPVYPLPEEDVKLIADSDFDVVLPYAELDRAQLDLLHKYQLKVIYNLKDTLLPKDRKEDPIDRFHKTLLSVKGHPAIVCWYINDEAPVSMIPLLTRARTLAEQLDPGLPTYSCLLNLAGLRQYLDSLDIVGTDPYPVPEKPLEMVREWTAKTRHACFGSRCTIMALQAFNWGYHWQKYGRTAAEIASARAPSFDEMNAMAWMSIAEGANGLLFYSFMDLKRMDNPPEGFKREDFTPRWNDLKRVASGIRKVEDVLLSAEPPPVLQAQSVSRHVAWRTFSLHGKKWLLVVNCSDTASGTAIFTEIDGKRLELTLKPMEVHFAAY